MPTFSVRSILRWSLRTDQKKKHVYEERITLWHARTMRQAIDLAEREADKYAGDDAKPLGLLQGFWMFDECRLRKQGIEVFSLLRESDLSPKAYLRTFFDTGCEREGASLPNQTLHRTAAQHASGKSRRLGRAAVGELIVRQRKRLSQRRS